MDLAALKLKPRTDRLTLLVDRIHEAYGNGAIMFAMAQALKAVGEVAWIGLKHEMERTLPLGNALASRLMLIHGKDDVDVLWTIEETLRSGVFSMIVGTPKKPLTLTQGRRLQLAAAQGKTKGLILIEDGGGCPAAESRWECRALPCDDENTPQHWKLMKDKKSPRQSGPLRHASTMRRTLGR